jgi:hypothetical protein
MHFFHRISLPGGSARFSNTFQEIVKVRFMHSQVRYAAKKCWGSKAFKWTVALAEVSRAMKTNLDILLFSSDPESNAEILALLGASSDEVDSEVIGGSQILLPLRRSQRQRASCSIHPANKYEIWITPFSNIKRKMTPPSNGRFKYSN